MKQIKYLFDKEDKASELFNFIELNDLIYEKCIISNPYHGKLLFCWEEEEKVG